MSIGDNPITVKFPKSATTLVTGKNGNGKSGLIIEPLVFGLFGKSFRGVVKNSLINSINQRDCVVNVKFSVGSDSYEVVRGMKPNIFDIYKNGKKEDNDAASRDQQKYLETQILKTTYNSFCQVVILGSAAYTPFMQLKAAQRREVIETLLDINVFSKMNKNLKEELSTWKNNLTDKRYQIEKLDHTIEMQEDFIKKIKLQNSDNTDEKKSQLKKIKEQLEKIQEKIDMHQEYVSVCETTVDVIDIESLNTKSADALTESSELKQKIKTLKKSIKFFNNDVCPSCEQDISGDYQGNKLKELTTELEAAESKLVKTEQVYSDITEQIRDYRAKRKECDEYQNILLSAKEKKKDLMKMGKELATSIKQTTTKSTESIDSEVEKLSGYKKELSDVKMEYKQLVDQKPMYEMAAKLLKDTGIKSAIIKQYLPVLNTQVNKYLQTLGFNIKFNLDENFKETLKSRHKDEFTYGNFSMGERMKLDICLLMAWRDVAKMKNSVNCNILIMDEVFDSSLDSDGLDALMEILNNQKDLSIVVISHRSGIEDKFMNHIEIKKDNGFTKLA
jgi:DNA repair exonuclease SbcCD ATPase subunit